MRYHTPVVFSDDPAIAEAASRRGWKVILRDGQLLRFAGLDPKQSVAMPEASLRIERGSLEGASQPLWNNVLNWLNKHIHRPMPIVEPNGYAMDLALWAGASRGWPFGVWLDHQFPIGSPGAIALLTSAAGFFVPKAEDLDAFTSRWPVAIRELPDTPLVPLPERPAPEALTREDGVTRVLLVGYYSGPAATVGVQRVNYWFEQLAQLSEGRVSVDLVTATEWPAPPERLHVVPDLGAAALTSGTGALESWAVQTLAGFRERAYSPSAHIAGFWTWQLEKYFDARDDHYDVVVLSGNPFAYFDFARYAKRRWYARTVVDYRDPFALNPRASLSDEARADAVDSERGWNMEADVVTTVNAVTRRLVVKAEPDTRVVVIPNGFDERSTVAPGTTGRPSSDGVRLGHAGQVFAQTPIDPLLRSLQGRDIELHHLGLPIAQTHGAQVVNHGRVDRDTVLSTLAGLDAGVAYVTESGIETPTKVFDYLLAGLDLILLHHGTVEDSALHPMLDGVEGVHWVHDDEESIGRFLDGYTPQRHDDPDRARRFSRESSSRILLDLITELGDHSFRR